MKRAQTSAEMLVVIGILLILLAAAIAFIGQSNIGFNLQRISAAKYWEGTDIGIVNSQQENSILRLTLQNNLLDDVRPVTVTISTDNRIQTHTLPSHTLTPTQRVTYNVSHAIDLTDTGERWEYDIQINYTNLNTGSSSLFIGEHKLRGQLVE